MGPLRENVHFSLVNTTVYMRVVNKTIDGRKLLWFPFLVSRGPAMARGCFPAIYCTRKPFCVRHTQPISWTLLNALPRGENNPLTAIDVWLLVFQPLLMQCGTGSALRSLLYELVDLFCSLDLKLKTLFEPPTLIILNSPCTAAPSLLHRHDS